MISCLKEDSGKDRNQFSRENSEIENMFNITSNKIN